MPSARNLKIMKNTDELKEALVGMGFEESIVLENPDYINAVIGYDEDGRVIYDYWKMIECLQEEGMTEEEATDFIYYNTVRALPYMGPKAPIIMYSFYDD